MRITLAGGTLFRETFSRFQLSSGVRLSQNTVETFVEAVKKNKDTGIAVDPVIYMDCMISRGNGIIPFTDEGIRSMIISFVYAHSDKFFGSNTLESYEELIKERAQRLLRQSGRSLETSDPDILYEDQCPSSSIQELDQYRDEESIISYSNMIAYSNVLLATDAKEVRWLLANVAEYKKNPELGFYDDNQALIEKMIEAAREEFKLMNQ